MNWLKVGAVVVGGIVVFFVVNSVIHVILGLLSAIVFVALVGGGVYVAAKVVGARKRRQEIGQREPRYREPQYGESRYGEPRRRRSRASDPRTTQPWSADSGSDPRNTVPWPATSTPPGGTPAAQLDVDDELARLKREMGR